MLRSAMSTILSITSYEKGHEFLRASAATGARTILLTVEKLREAPWPRDVLAEVYLLPSFDEPNHVLNAVSYLARTERIARIVALDEFDMEVAALLREHLRVPGMGVTAARGVRDKLAMRELAAAAGIPVPEFVAVVHHDTIRQFLTHTSAPWVLKPRMQASAIGIRKLYSGEELWPILEQLGDKQSHYVLERFVPGDVFHVDGIVIEGEVVFADAHQYAQPPFDTMHAGGIFASRSIPRGSAEDTALRARLTECVRAVSIDDGVVHAEFIRSRDGSQFYFLEIAARVGGAHIAEMVEAATGVNLWREWARLEVAQARGEPYVLPETRQDYAGVLISLARQEWPDTSEYNDREVVWRMNKRHHAGLIVRSPRAERVQELQDAYLRRFQHDFYTSLPAPERATQ